MGIEPGSSLKKPMRDVPFLEHFALYVGDHWWRGCWNAWVLEIRKHGPSELAEVEIVPLDHFCRTGNVTFEPPPRGIDEERLWATAKRLRAQRWVRYSLLNVGDGVNCESLTRLIQVGRKESKQANTFWTGVLAAGTAAFLYMVTKDSRSMRA
jgi:hypothetical protein